MKKFEKYLKRKNAPIPQLHLDIIKQKKEMAINDILSKDDIDTMLDDGYLAGENGYRRMADGSAFIAVCTQMPNVTLEMIDWWFWWHPKEAVRYQIWYPKMHFDTSADFGGYYDDETKSYRERLHLSTHTVTEDIGLGKEQIMIDFMSPVQFGFDKNKLDRDDVTIICGRGGSPENGVWTGDMCHFVRKVEKGVEMRSRFWIGRRVERMSGFGKPILNTILNFPFVKRNLVPKEMGIKLFHHCSQEYHNLADILPEVYEMYGKKA